MWYENTDLVHAVQLHLKPRHLLKLLCVNKQFYKMLKANSYYFDRVAAHLVWRQYVVDCQWPWCDLNDYGKIERALVNRYLGVERESLFYMLNTTRSYHDCMEIFLSFLTNCMVGWPNMILTARICQPHDFSSYADAPLDAKVRLILRTALTSSIRFYVQGRYSPDEVETMSMVDVIKRELSAAACNVSHRFHAVRTVLRSLEDSDSVPTLLKRQISEHLETFLAHR